jgi:hypothetical protein
MKEGFVTVHEIATRWNISIRQVQKRGQGSQHFLFWERVGNPERFRKADAYRQVETRTQNQRDATARRGEG